MKNLRLLTVLLLLAALLFSLEACKKGNTVPEGTYELKNSGSITPVKIKMPLDPAAVYASIEYIPEMFYGTYIQKIAAEDPENETAEATKGEQTTVSEGAEDQNKENDNAEAPAGEEGAASGLPCGIHAVRTETAAETGLYPMTLTFKTADGIPYTKDCTYTVEGKKLKFSLVSGFKYDNNNNIIACSYTGQELVCDFVFSGAVLTLSANGESVALVSEMFSKEPPSFYFSGYSCADHDTSDILRHIEFSWGGSVPSRLLISDANHSSTERAVASISKNGLFTLTLPLSSGKQAVQYVYFYASPDDLVLANDTGVYCFNSDWFDAYKKSLIDNLTEEEAENLKNMTEEELAAIIKRKEALIEDISKAFADVGINVEVNKNTGEIAMDASVLFGGDSAQISDPGKEMLKKISQAYSQVIFKEEYADFVSSITIAGHTAPVKGSTPEENLSLSTQRAENVKTYCTSSETGLEQTVLGKLKAVMTPVGLSDSDPIYNKDGEVDLAASRRVSFRLVINIAAPEQEAAAE